MLTAINPKFKMVLIQFTGLSGSGKTTLSSKVEKVLTQNGYKVERIDGDIYVTHRLTLNTPYGDYWSQPENETTIR